MEPDKTHFQFYAATRLKLGDSATQVHQDLKDAWGDAVPSLRTIQRWMKDVNDGMREPTWAMVTDLAGQGPQGQASWR